MTRAEKIILDVCREHQVARHEIMARYGRPRDKLVTARAEIAKRIKAGNPRLSLSQIGAMLGGRDHTTILYYLRKAA